MEQTEHVNEAVEFSTTNNENERLAGLRQAFEPLLEALGTTWNSFEEARVPERLLQVDSDLSWSIHGHQ